MTRWSVVVSDDTDRALRRYLADSGGRKGSISAFIEETVRKEVAHRTIEAMKERNASYSASEVEAAIDDAVREARDAPGS